MAATASPMASQLRSSFASSTRGLIIPKGISAAPLRVLPCRRNSSFTIKAVQTDKLLPWTKLHSMEEGKLDDQPWLNPIKTINTQNLLSKLFSPSMVTHLSGASRLR
ncbi:hypothetical protein CsSME_00015974 [Camellia sinensis var. sinensis]